MIHKLFKKAGFSELDDTMDSLVDLKKKQRKIKGRVIVEENVVLSDFLEINFNFIVTQYSTDIYILNSIVNNESESGNKCCKLSKTYSKKRKTSEVK